MNTPEQSCAAHKHHRWLALRQLHARPRLFASAAVALVSLLALKNIYPHFHYATCLLLAWNIGVVLYLMLAAHMIAKTTHERLRWRARIQDEGRIVVLAVVILASIACLGAIFAQLLSVKTLSGTLKYAHISLAILTIASAWLFVHLMFALHYAHDYYSNVGHQGDGGLDFPSTPQPDYWDFLYFAYVIGTSGQTADVSFTASKMRRLGLIHCTLAYAFNTTVLAFAINIASGLM